MKNTGKTGVPAGKTVTGGKTTQGPTTNTTKGPDPKHLPREFK